MATKKNFLGYPKSALAKARHLRRTMTDAEKKLWGLLRSNRTGAHFRRQAPFGPYIIDFLCIKAKLAIELDGGQHYQEKGLAHDARRDSYLGQRGLTVLRFSDRDFLTNPQGVMEMIYEHIQKP